MSPSETLERLARKLADAGRRDRVGSVSMKDHAALRRMDPLAPGPSAVALYQLLAQADLPLEDADRVRRWAVAVHALALSRGAHERGRDIGTALVGINFGEARLAQLLSADFPLLADLVPRLARRLHAQQQRVDFIALVQLLLHVDRDRDRAEDARLAIARSFVKATHNDQKNRTAS